jgi:protein-L-isoaspartate(D-aspartate) O-methyltransferase
MQASPAATIRFLADSMVGKLSRWLRLLGYDVRYERSLEDSLLVADAVNEGRILLTRDRRLVERRACRRYVLLSSDDPWEQLEEVIRVLDLPVEEDRWLQRCLECNGTLEEADREDVKGEVPPYVYAHHEHFARCADCQQIYWRGTHVSGMLEKLRELSENARHSAGESAGSGGRSATSTVLLVMALTLAGGGNHAGIAQVHTDDPSVPGPARIQLSVRAASHGGIQDDQFAEARAALLRQLRREGIQDEEVLAAISRVPRHLFVPDEYLDHAYANQALPIGHGQTISQPYIVALMSELLQVGAGEKVLEIGTGSGYQAAVLAEMGCEVFSIEILQPLAELAARNLARIGQDGVHTRVGDGYLGWPEEAPFPRIIVTAAPEEIPERLVEQLAIGGRMVVPVGPRYGNQVLMLLVKEEDGELRVRRILPVRFVPMVHDPRIP